MMTSPVEVGFPFVDAAGISVGYLCYIVDFEYILFLVFISIDVCSFWKGFLSKVQVGSAGIIGRYH